VLMGDEYNICGYIVTLANIWVNVDNEPIFSGQPETAVTLIK